MYVYQCLGVISHLAISSSIDTIIQYDSYFIYIAQLGEILEES